MKKITIFIFTILVTSQVLVAQNLKKVDRLLEQKSYKEASELLLKEKNQSQEVLEKLGDCYYYTKNMSEATKWYKTLVEKHENKVDKAYLYKYAKSLKGTGNYSEADIWYQKYSGKNISTDAYLESLKEDAVVYEIQAISANSSASDFGPSYYGDKVVFASARGEGGDIYKWTNQAYLDLYSGNVNEEGDIVSAEAFSNSINSKLHEANAAFTKDGKTMYFTRNGSSKGKSKITHMKIYKAEFANGEWENIKELPFNDKNYSVMHPALSNDEKQLYFSSDMSGSFDIYVVDITNGKLGTPKKLGNEVNSESLELFPHISSDNTLYFSSDRYEGYGGLDIFKSEKVSGAFSNAKNLGEPINSNEDDFSFIINDENELGYFASNRGSGLSDNIYKFEIAQDLFIAGIVKDANTSEILPGTEVKIIDLNEVSSTVVTVGEDAKYSFEADRGKSYTISVNKQNYTPFSVNLTVTKDNIDKDIYLDQEKVVENFNFSPIYFDFDKHDIKPEYYEHLNSIVQKMSEYPNRIVKLSTFTDAFGPDIYNLELSEKRAKSVINYLKDKGLESSRIQSKAYGKTKVVIDCNKGEDCKKATAKERRCEFDLSTTLNN
ncbi:hypothetical protein A8C32_03015 [Flavivirga aquatica]|uniref:OmpA-like domain-containing protein n=1 Tax=Flavivirga aquatica TaxID=1849968 RepID=A0A1E5TAP5_9FLAO|nr:OmpA family protein [Flavivirga aquatica]OEK08434.1 hypothetical protein A8C32_03015 [Flavivirga aquatica]